MRHVDPRAAALISQYEALTAAGLDALAALYAEGCHFKDPFTDVHGRALRDDGSVIDGLYAAGNVSAPVMGHTYPGPGGTIGPAMAFGYLAALHLAGKA